MLNWSVMVADDRRMDEALLAAAWDDEDAFAVFYARYERAVAGFFVRAVGRGELAADLTAEVFAEALGSVRRFDPALGTAGAWLFGIARNVLARSGHARAGRSTTRAGGRSPGMARTGAQPSACPPPSENPTSPAGRHTASLTDHGGPSAPETCRWKSQAHLY